jgi:hypothetical protein
MCPMSADQDSGDAPREGDAGPSVLANLPRTRPQRATARRAAARTANGGPPADPSPRKPAAQRRKPKTAPSPAPAKAAAQAGGKQAAGKQTPAKRTSPRPKRAAPAKPSARARRAPAPQPVSEPVPRQGFESEWMSASGSVPPPGGAEFIATAAEIVSEVARASLSTGERLVRDALARLRP